MELEVIKKTKNLIKLKIKGEDHTFCNALTKELWADKDTEIAGYSIAHSLTEEPILTFESKKDVIKALNDAAERIKKTNKTFKENCLKLLNE
ncbi:MAG: DNA-directed RNA polymerase subunit L [Nanoarchaeota archaeon]